MAQESRENPRGKARFPLGIIPWLSPDAKHPGWPLSLRSLNRRKSASCGHCSFRLISPSAEHPPLAAAEGSSGPEAQSRQARLFFSSSSGNLLSFRVKQHPQERVQGIIPCRGVWGRGGPRMPVDKSRIFATMKLHRIF